VVAAVDVAAAPAAAEDEDDDVVAVTAVEAVEVVGEMIPESWESTDELRPISERYLFAEGRREVAQGTGTSEHVNEVRKPSSHMGPTHPMDVNVDTPTIVVCQVCMTTHQTRRRKREKEWGVRRRGGGRKRGQESSGTALG